MKKQLDSIDAVICLLYSALSDRNIINLVHILAWVWFLLLCFHWLISLISYNYKRETIVC